MKKTILTLSLAVLFSLAYKAQDSKSKHAQQQPAAATKTVVNSDGTTSTVSAAPSTQEATPVKKSGTRMAINEKGIPAKSKTEKKESAK